MALSKSWILKDLQASIEVAASIVTTDKIQPKTIKKALNYALQSTVQQLPAEEKQVYKRPWTISDESASSSTAIVTDATYTDSTRNVLKTLHGLSFSDVGKRVSGWVSGSRAVIAEVESIVDANNFIITKSLGADASATFNYVVFSAHSSESVDLSALVPALDEIIKISDSVNGIATPLMDDDFEATDITDQEKGVFWNRIGDTLYLKKGRLTTSYGTLTLTGYRFPDILVNSTDYIDIKDEFVPLVLERATKYIFDILNISKPSTAEK